jgi:hypothetical protein
MDRSESAFEKALELTPKDTPEHEELEATVRAIAGVTRATAR